MDTVARSKLDSASMFDLHGRLAWSARPAGIGLAMAEALAGAGPTSSASARSSRRTAARFSAVSKRWAAASRASRSTWPIEPRSRSSPPASLPASADRHSRQQRGHDRPRAGGRSRHRHMGAGARDQPDRPFLLARALGRGMVQRGSGKIIFTASLLSFQGESSCRATRREIGIAGLVKALANEWAPHGVNVNAIAPVTSPPTTPRRCAPTPPQPRDPRANSAGRWGDAADLAGATVFSRRGPPTTCVDDHRRGWRWLAR